MPKKTKIKGFFSAPGLRHKSGVNHATRDSQ